MDLDLGFLTSVLEAAFSHLSLMYLGTLTSQTPLWLFSRSKSLSDFLLPLLDPAPLLDITCALVQRNNRQTSLKYFNHLFAAHFPPRLSNCMTNISLMKVSFQEIEQI